jgi:hypothetical protein
VTVSPLYAPDRRVRRCENPREGETCKTLLIGRQPWGKPQLPTDRPLIGKRDWGNCELLLIEVLLGCAY